MTTAARVAVTALRPTLRSVPWRPLLAAAASAGVAVWLINPAAGEVRGMVALRVTGLLLAAGAAFGIDDPAAATLAASPTPLGVRRTHRLFPVGLAWGLLWTLALVTIANEAPGVSLAIPSVEAGAMLALALAAAALAAPHVPESRGGFVAGPALTLAMVGVLMAQYLYPRWITLFALSPADPEWDAARIRWIVLLAAALVALAATSLDPARARRVATWQARQTRLDEAWVGPRRTRRDRLTPNMATDTVRFTGCLLWWSSRRSRKRGVAAACNERATVERERRCWRVGSPRR